MGKVLCIALALYSLSLSAQEITKDSKGRTVITLDEKQSKECEKQGCFILPSSVIEYLVKEYAAQLCGKKI